MTGGRITVACVKWGTWCAPHTAKYVEHLFRGVRRHLDAPHRFVCFTDDPTGLPSEVETHPLPENLKGSWWNGPYVNRDLRALRPLMALPYLLARPRDKRSLIADDIRKTWQPINLYGWWNKLYLFKPGVLEGRVIFFDLDTVICASLAQLAEYRGEFAILQDFNRPQNFGSGVMLWEAERCGDVWNRFVEAGCPNLRRGDQVWMQKTRPEADLLQHLYPGMFASYKVHCRDGPPEGTSAICFHGSPRPHEVDDVWLRELWSGLDA